MTIKELERLRGEVMDDAAGGEDLDNIFTLAASMLKLQELSSAGRASVWFERRDPAWDVPLTAIDAAHAEWKEGRG